MKDAFCNAKAAEASSKDAELCFFEVLLEQAAGVACFNSDRSTVVSHTSVRPHSRRLLVAILCMHQTSSLIARPATAVI